MTTAVEQLLDEARSALRANDLVGAISACEQARKIEADDPRLLLIHGVALRRSGEEASAEKLLRSVLEHAPALPLAHHELGVALVALGRLSDARGALERAVRLQPDLKAAWRALYDVRAAEGDDIGAAEAYRNVLGTDEVDPALRKALELVAAGRLGIAEGICREYLRQRPMDVNAIRLLAEIGITLGIVDEAIKLLERCLELAPDFHVARSNYATALGRAQRFDAALEQVQRLEIEQSTNISHKVQSAALLSMAGRFEEAHAKFETVLGQISDNARILTSYGHSLRYGGKGGEATKAYLRAVEADPSAGEAYWSLANLKTFRFSADRVAVMRARLAGIEQASADKYHLAFALGKALEDEQSFDDSFEAYAMGNAIKKQFSAYDHAMTTQRVDSMMTFCGQQDFDQQGHPSEAPIFIVGLPRTGSTLLEQILSSHPQVEATAELPFIGQIASELSGRRNRLDDSRYPEILAELDPDQRREWGRFYLERAEIYRKGAPRFIDKLPNNWLHIALIRSILPNATIIDARREPMAACFANFKQLFARGQEFTYGLEDIAHYYADYLRMVTQWQERYPGDVRTVHYEAVVSGLENEVRAMLEHCRLPFDAACLKFHEQDRAIRTASSEQVRQPIYRDALVQWRNFASHLQPLRKTLSERGVVGDPDAAA